MGGQYESREPREPEWQPEPLYLPQDEVVPITPEHQAEDQDVKDQPGTHVVVIDLA